LPLPEFHWLSGHWAGKLALAARPRGGDWLPDELESWKRSGVQAILSLLTPDEEQELGLADEAKEAKRIGLRFSSYPIEDRGVPKSEAELGRMLDTVNGSLRAGRNVLVHCRQGIGRTGLVAACLLVKNGMSPGAAVDAVSAARGVAVPETVEQREWIERYAPAFAK
jgi:protein-tyrosine phosphatase